MLRFDRWGGGAWLTDAKLTQSLSTSLILWIHELSSYKSSNNTLRVGWFSISPTAWNWQKSASTPLLKIINWMSKIWCNWLKIRHNYNCHGGPSGRSINNLYSRPGALLNLVSVLAIVHCRHCMNLILNKYTVICKWNAVGVGMWDAVQPRVCGKLRSFCLREDEV